MRIVLTGGGTGGHFYPLIAVAEALRTIGNDIGASDLLLYYFSTNPGDSKLLNELGISYARIPSGKRRPYASFQNFLDLWKIGWGICVALIRLFFIYPDVVFSKGGYASVPTVCAARVLKIPVVIHESDTIPGKVNLWSGRFAIKIALSWKEASSYFPKERVAVTGQPIREELLTPIRDGSFHTFGLTPEAENRPTIAIFGGSQGAQSLNDSILDILPALLSKYNVIHQTGEKNFNAVSARARVILEKETSTPYRAYPFFGEKELVRVAGIADLIISRAGSFIFEIAAWGTPAILIPLPPDISHDQTTNAFSYARVGGAVVIEQANLAQGILLAEIERALGSPAKDPMRTSAHAFATLDAAPKIAKALFDIVISHENS